MRLPTGTELRCSCAWLAGRPILSHWGTKKGRLSEFKVACLSITDVLYCKVLTFCCRSNVSRSNLVSSAGTGALSGTGQSESRISQATLTRRGRQLRSVRAARLGRWESSAVQPLHRLRQLSEHWVTRCPAQFSTTVGYPSSTAATLSCRNGGIPWSRYAVPASMVSMTSYPEVVRAGIESVTTDVSAQLHENKTLALLMRGAATARLSTRGWKMQHTRPHCTTCAEHAVVMVSVCTVLDPRRLHSGRPTTPRHWPGSNEYGVKPCTYEVLGWSRITKDQSVSSVSGCYEPGNDCETAQLPAQARHPYTGVPNNVII